MMPQAAWKATLGELELQMAKTTFNTWLRDTELISAENGVFTIGVRTAYAKDWLENRFRQTILRTLTAVIGHKPELVFVVEASKEIEPVEPYREPRLSEKRQNQPTRISPRPSGAQFNPRYVFREFVVGNSNRLAAAAAESVAENPGQAYNPLFIYGGVGLGKTHLLHAIGNHCVANGLNVLYISSETFTNDLVQSIREQRTAEFRDKYRTPDLLLIDDIQFVAGKESTQEELFHTFNVLHSSGKQVVLSSDRPPRAMATLEERLRSRFEWGLMADIQKPDVELRLAILQKRAADMRIEVPANVLDIIAHNIRSSVRELEGAFNKVIAYGQLNGVQIDAKLVDMALADIIRRPEKVTVEAVLDSVCAHYHVSRDDLYSKSRSRSIAFPRQIGMYLCRTETDASLPQIGVTLGNRDHTTIMYGFSKIAGLVDSDPNVRRDVLEIKSKLYESRM